MEAYKMMLDFAGVDELLQSFSESETTLALEELLNMLEKDRTDPLRLSDMIPHVLLEHGEEQRCYDFIKWWALHGPKSPSGSLSSPFFDLEGADACECPSTLTLSGLSLSHLVALTLLKLRLCMDLEALSEQDFDTSIGFDDDGPTMNRSLGYIAEDVFESTSEWLDFAKLEVNMERQYFDLCKKVNEVNPHFWEALVTEEPNFSSASEAPGPGSRDEADFVLYHCRRAWDKSSGALNRIECDTSHYVRVHTGLATINESKSLKRHRGTGRVFPTKLDDEDALFHIKDFKTRGWSVYKDQSKLLLYTGGHCEFEGKQCARGGWSVWFRSINPRLPCPFVSDCLEKEGPFGDCENHTRNRAELRAVVAALRLKDWKAEGFTSIVVATTSTYVLNGATIWAKTWVSDGWKLQGGEHVENKDLWQSLLGEVERWDSEGLDVCLLEIPQHLNEITTKVAKVAAEAKPDRDEFTDITLSPYQPSKPRLQPYTLFVCLAGIHHFETSGSSNTCAPLYEATEHAFHPEAALKYLNGPLPPSNIIIADAMITRHREVLERIIDHMRDGAAVMVSGSFGTMVTRDELCRFFSILDLPWQEDPDSNSPSIRHVEVQDFGLRAMGYLPLPIGGIRQAQRPVSWYTDLTSRLPFTKIGLGRIVLDLWKDTNSSSLFGKLELATVDHWFL